MTQQAPTNNYRSINFSKLTDTIAGLAIRVSERFSDSNLAEICLELKAIAMECESRAQLIGQPILSIRYCIAVLVIGVLYLLISSLSLVELDYRALNFLELTQLTETLANGIILVGASLYFLLSIEARLKRFKALNALHELRSMAHIIDMLQLTKDPIMYTPDAARTAHSPRRELSPFELNRYLDYCTETLSLIGKLAAIYSERLPDAEIVTAANEIEILCASMSRKIWQKMSMITPGHVSLAD